MTAAKFKPLIFSVVVFFFVFLIITSRHGLLENTVYYCCITRTTQENVFSSVLPFLQRLPSNGWSHSWLFSDRCLAPVVYVTLLQNRGTAVSSRPEGSACNIWDWSCLTSPWLDSPDDFSPTTPAVPFLRSLIQSGLDSGRGNILLSFSQRRIRL
jgi:hypothetical protein